jgi:2-polyprenyl-6-methoxyphenol hydroxylase-like FAD-dependent oxidoreductase
LQAAGAVRFNFIKEYARLLTDQPAGALDGFDPFDTITTCRRPVLEHAFVVAARETPGIEVRNDTVVTALELGRSAVDGATHVVGVRTGSDEVIGADVVVDAAGRRSPTGRLLADAGAEAPTEHAEDVGFVYNTQMFRGDGIPEVRGDVLAAAGSISVLTMPGDNGHWSVTLYHSPKDKALRAVRDPEVFARVVRSLPLHAHWVDGERVNDVVSMASTANTRRAFVRPDGAPIVTGLVPVGDAWGFTNPSLGRGIALGLVHAVDVADAIAANIDDPSALGRAWHEKTSASAEQWHDATVQFDRIRGPEVEAQRQGLPDPHDPGDAMVAAFRAFDSARHHDVDVLRWWGEQASCLTLPFEVAMRPGVFDRVLEVAAAHPPYATPAPTRDELEALVA